MDLKSLLTEQKSVEKLNNLLQEKYRDDIRHLIYRGTSTSVENYDVRQIRKDRIPRDTPMIIEGIVSAYEQNLYSNYPKRSESKFGATNRKVVSVYGSHQVVVFPEKDASVKSLEKDSTPIFFKPAFYSLKRVLEDSSFNRWMKNLKEKGFKDLLNFFGLAIKFKVGNLNFDSWKNYLNKNLNSVLKEVKKLSSSDLDDSIAENVTYVFHNIERYFKQGKDQVGQNDDEVIFDGDTYLRVDPKIFESNFMWSGRRWVRS